MDGRYSRQLPIALLAAALLCWGIAGPAGAVNAAALSGQPSVTADSPAGYYLWADSSGLHVRTSTGGKLHNFSGTVTTNTAIEHFSTVGADVKSGDYCRQNGATTVEFSYMDRGEVGGFDIKATGAAFVLTLQLDGRAIPAQVWLGAAKTAATELPLTIEP